MSRSAESSKPPLRWTGILFAFAANLLLVTVADLAARALPFGINAEFLATFVAPLIAGVATALYTGSRGGMHAFVGALIAFPVLGLVTFQGVWPLAIFATAFCIMAATGAELIQRRRSTSTTGRDARPRSGPPKRKRRS